MLSKTLVCTFLLLLSATAVVTSTGEFHSASPLASLSHYEVVHVQSDWAESAPEVQARDARLAKMRSAGGMPHSMSMEQAPSIHRLSAQYEHPATAQFQYHGQDGLVTARLERNTDLFAPSYRVQTVTVRPGARALRRTVVDYDDVKDTHCHYRGDALHHASDAEGWVRVSACTGSLKGAFLGADGEIYGIEPAHLHMSPSQLAAQVRRMAVTVRSRAQTMAMNERTGQTGGAARDEGVVAGHTLHVVFRASDLETAGSCAVGDEAHPVHVPAHARPHHTHGHSHDHTHSHAHDHHGHATAIGAAREHVRRHQEQEEAAQGSARQLTTATRYVELMIVNDYLRYQQQGSSTTDTADDAAGIINVVDSFYQGSTLTYPLQVVLVGQIVHDSADPWTLSLGTCGDCSAGEADVDELLPEFHSYYSVFENHDIVHDNRHLLSGHDFSANALGYAGVAAMCYAASSGGINMARTDMALATISAVVAHEMGHNLGCQHDAPGTNGCPSSGFIMNAVLGVPPTEFSSCSNTYMRNFIDSGVTCMDNYPTSVWGDPVCGNGFVEDGEDCDVGPLADPCCDLATCTFVAGAACSLNSACCNSTCGIVPAGDNQVCRAAAGSCDVAEVCNGVDAGCPMDVGKGAGRSCTDDTYGDGLCMDGVCMSLSRDCLERTSSYSGGPYDACPTQGAIGDGNYCGTLYCSASPPTCNYFTSGGSSMKVADGVPCGGGKMCKNSQCVAAFNLNTEFEWIERADWTNCTSCSQKQNQTVECVHVSDNTTAVAEELCSDNKPDFQRACQNETLGCVAASSSSDDSTIDILGYEIAKTSMVLGTLAFFAGCLLILAACYFSMTCGDPQPWGDQGNTRSRKRAAKYT